VYISNAIVEPDSADRAILPTIDAGTHLTDTVTVPCTEMPVGALPERASWDAIFEALPAGVVVLDSRGRVVRCNAAAVTLLGEPLLHEAWRAVISRAVDVEQNRGAEVALRNGRLVRIETTPLQGAGQVLLFHDVTEICALQGRLQAQERSIALGKIAASLAHQIRTPVSAALLYSSNLKDADLAEHDRARFQARIHERLEHIEALTRQILQFVRGPRRTHESLEVQQILNESLAALEAKFGDLSGRVASIVEANLPALTGSHDLVVTALFNLLSNAFQAGGPEVQGLVHVSTNDDGHLVFAVADDGPGIAAELKEHVLEPFFTTRVEGNGLGLAVVRDVAEVHGGRLHVYSELCQGTFFSMTIAPVEPVDETLVPAHQERAE